MSDNPGDVYVGALRSRSSNEFTPLEAFSYSVPIGKVPSTPHWIDPDMVVISQPQWCASTNRSRVSGWGPHQSILPSFPRSLLLLIVAARVVSAICCFHRALSKAPV
eukprot:1137798-Pelagomonas_calceolata.AAC.1